MKMKLLIIFISIYLVCLGDNLSSTTTSWSWRINETWFLTKLRWISEDFQVNNSSDNKVTLQGNIWTERMSQKIKWDEWGLGHQCTCGLTGPGEPPEDVEIKEMALPSRHRIQNSSLGGLRPSTLPLGHGCSSQYFILTSERGRTIFVSLKLECQSRVRSPTFQAGSFNHCTRAPPSEDIPCRMLIICAHV